MESFDDSAWDIALDYSCFMELEDVGSPAFSWVNQCSGTDIDFSQVGGGVQEQEYSVKDYSRKRSRTEANSKPGTKAVRERLRREKLNDSFLDLSCALEAGRAAKTDKLAILNDAIRVVSQLRTETEEYKEENKKLKEEIELLKAEKNELRQEKLALKMERENMEQQLNLKTMTVPSSELRPSYPETYHARRHKSSLYVSYGMVPMWHYLPQSTRDTSRDHVLRPPAA